MISVHGLNWVWLPLTSSSAQSRKGMLLLTAKRGTWHSWRRSNQKKSNMWSEEQSPSKNAPVKLLYNSTCNSMYVYNNNSYSTIQHTCTVQCTLFSSTLLQNVTATKGREDIKMKTIYCTHVHMTLLIIHCACVLHVPIQFKYITHYYCTCFYYLLQVVLVHTV